MEAMETALRLRKSKRVVRKEPRPLVAHWEAPGHPKVILSDGASNGMVWLSRKKEAYDGCFHKFDIASRYFRPAN